MSLLRCTLPRLKPSLPVVKSGNKSSPRIVCSKCGGLRDVQKATFRNANTNVAMKYSHMRWDRPITWCMRRYYQHPNSFSQVRCFASMPSHCFVDDEFVESACDDLYAADEIPDMLYEMEDILHKPKMNKNLSKSDLDPHHLRKQSNFLLNYVQACVNSGHLGQAINAVKSRQSLTHLDIKTFEYLLQTLNNLPRQTHEEKIDVVGSTRLLFGKILQENLTPSPNTCACMLAALQKYNADCHVFSSMVSKVEESYTLKECLDACHRDGETYKHLRIAMETLEPNFNLQDAGPQQKKPPPILHELYKKTPSNGAILMPNNMTLENLMERFTEQLGMEVKNKVRIPNVLSHEQKVSPKQKAQREKLEKLHQRWFPTALKAFKEIKRREKRKWSNRRSHPLGTFPFLCLLSDKSYVEIIIDHINRMPASGVITHETINELGNSVYSRYFLNHYLNNNAEERLRIIYEKYLSLYQDNASSGILRELWEELEFEHGKMQLENHIVPWQSLWKTLVGKLLLEVMVSSLTVGLGNANTTVPSAYFTNIPAVFNSYKPWGKKVYGMTIPHPMYVKLVKEAKGDFLFETAHLPMIAPPIPWLHQNQGGFLCCLTDFVRRKFYTDLTTSDDHVQSYNDGLCASADALNVLSSVAWKINKRVLDVQLKMFRSNGNESLKIAPPPPELKHRKSLKDLPLEEKKKLQFEYFKAKKQKYEMNSLHADALYKFSIANHYRDRLIWLPHNMDFRGRTYPTPPHFNYMGDDVSRSLFLFADGQPLGKRGLEWLKIHIINLTGKKKYGNLPSRLEYAEEMLDEILDSADNPLDGRCWWKESEEPWQTLAACMELADALRSPDPEKFVSNHPIYQDGSCNGLQHYAALGRDVIGAAQVNLKPSDVPQDIYTGVAEIVEELRRKDADDGVEIAKDLDGFITRKVVKQTVMTTVYGVTRYGGTLQIKRQLQNLNYPSNKKPMKAAMYIANAIFQSISTIFTSATNIQKWFTDIATCVSKGGRSVEWQTTLGLRAVQPYYKSVSIRVDSPLQRINITNSTTTPAVMKQCNAFPPNFVHSLDSTHMMLTALRCYHAGVKFSAVHDCYWTHASTVDHMNMFCREQFIELHNEPILQRLADHLRKFLPAHELDESNQLVSPDQREKLKELLDNIPTKGEFDLNEVKNSTFFFS